jgi:hypothetical protein
MRARLALRMGETANEKKLLVGKAEGKRQLGRPKPKCENVIKIDTKETGCEVVDWIQLAQDRDPVACSCKYDKNLSGTLKFGKFFDQLRATISVSSN